MFQAMGAETMKVRDVMGRPPVMVEPDASVRAAVELMRSHRVRHLPVTEQGRLIGILTDRDVRHAAFLPLLAPHLPGAERRLQAPRVRDVMTWSVVTIEPEAELVRAGLLMFERRIGSLPVTHEGVLVGIVTERDVFEAFRAVTGDVVPPEIYLG
jgi:acetoin utilization protein AcuB